MRAQRCYEVAKLAPDVGPPRTFCTESCRDCDFYRLVQGQRTNVLVVTDDPQLTRELRAAEAGLSFNIEIADCEYTCSTIVNHFRPDYAIVDCSLGTQPSRDIANHLIEDPRAPFVRVVLAGNEDEFPNECKFLNEGEFPSEGEIVVYAKLNRPFGIDDINECIEGIKPDDWEENKRM